MKRLTWCAAIAIWYFISIPMGRAASPAKTSATIESNGGAGQAKRLSSSAKNPASNRKAGSAAKKMLLAPVMVRAKRMVPSRLMSDREALERLERTPGGVAQVTEAHIRRRRAANLSEVLDFVPGVTAGSRHGPAQDDQISIRGSGLESRYETWGISLLQDGFALNQADGLAVTQPLDMDFVKRIEIYKGASAMRFGGDMMGGAINLVTKTGYDAPALEVGSEVGSYGFVKNYLGSGHVAGRWDSYLGLSDAELGGFRDHSIQVQRRMFGTVGYTGDDGATARLDTSYMSDSEDLPGELTRSQLLNNPSAADPTYVGKKSAREFDFLRTGLTVTKPLGEGQMLEAYAQFFWHDYENPLPFAIVEGSTYNWNGELRYLNDIPLFNCGNHLTAGLQYGGTMWKDLNYVNDEGETGAALRNQWDRALALGAYAEDDFDLTRELSLVFGGRVDYARRSVSGFASAKDYAPTGVADFVSGLSPKAGFVYRLKPTIQFFGNVSRAYQPPILKEEEAPNQNPSTASVDTLRAERGWQFETGARGSWKERAKWDFAVYDYEIHNEILNFNRLPFPHAKFVIPSYINVPRTRHSGVEFGTSLTILRNASRLVGFRGQHDQLAARVAYTWSRFRFVDNRTHGNNQIPGLAPENRINAEITYSNAYGYWVQPYVYTVPGGWAVNSVNTVYAPPYTLVGVRAGYDYKPWHCRLFFEAANLTDASWAAAIAPDAANQRFFDPGDGRSFYGGISWHL
jgi:iron complex outermembrane receptor protein